MEHRVKATNPEFWEGRPKKYTATQLNHAMDLLHEASYTKVEAMTGISKSTLVREARRRRAAKEIKISST